MASDKSVAIRQAKAAEDLNKRLRSLEEMMEEILDWLDAIADHLGIEVEEDGDHKS